MKVCFWFGTLAECREPNKCNSCLLKVMCDTKRKEYEKEISEKK